LEISNFDDLTSDLGQNIKIELKIENTQSIILMMCFDILEIGAATLSRNLGLRVWLRAIGRSTLADKKRYLYIQN
jgi:hypothetical protein